MPFAPGNLVESLLRSSPAVLGFEGNQSDDRSRFADKSRSWENRITVRKFDLWDYNKHKVTLLGRVLAPC